jgi:hypothetical protein
MCRPSQSHWRDDVPTIYLQLSSSTFNWVRLGPLPTWVSNSLPSSSAGVRSSRDQRYTFSPLINEVRLSPSRTSWPTLTGKCDYKSHPCKAIWGHIVGICTNNEFDIDYHPRTAIKAQVVADFITKFTEGEEDPQDEEGVQQPSTWVVDVDRFSN